ncbi:cysteine hydrolase family protein [Aliamphritea ceti]|uniref:cysteine hydrolase family protein n=1 Tax=Aliamphritea ceti TaxID=1524258 RepID=UPI0021C440A6|nr:cysteine hydrolase family protein [Aliamphritea ceti]
MLPGIHHDLFISGNPALIVIDVQDAIDCYSDYSRNNPDAEKVIASLLMVWRDRGLPVVHVRHASKFENSPYHPASDFFSFKYEAEPLMGEAVITKQENCAFIGTELEALLKAQEVTELVICGVLSNNSVDATVRVASGLGFRVMVPDDASAAFAMDLLTGKQLSAEDVHWAFLSNLHGEYCQVCESGELLQALPQAH